ERGHRIIERLPETAAPSFVLRGGTVLTAAGDRLAPGYVVVRDGHITDVGGGDPPLVEGATVLDVTGRFVTPGLIDAHSHFGVYPAPGFEAHSGRE
ncbi:MAG: hypothetical protein ACREDF_11435, partial [Thermoplasmata archaeon]